MFKFKSLVFLCFPAAIVASPAAERYAPNAPFGLYGYGDGIGGASVFTSGDTAYLGNASQIESTEVAPVEFVVNTGNILLGSPNNTARSNTPTWSNLTFIVPDTTSSSHNVSFSNSTEIDSVSASGFVFYGQFLLHEDTDGSLKSLWYAIPSDFDDVWYLEWNSTDSEGAVPLTMKATPPSRGTGTTE